jgi:hypothetical protein
MNSAYLSATEKRTFYYPVPEEVKSRKVAGMVTKFAGRVGDLRWRHLERSRSSGGAKDLTWTNQ